jgi:hypothetical protein
MQDLDMLEVLSDIFNFRARIENFLILNERIEVFFSALRPQSFALQSTGK